MEEKNHIVFSSLICTADSTVILAVGEMPTLDDKSELALGLGVRSAIGRSGDCGKWGILAPLRTATTAQFLDVAMRT